MWASAALEKPQNQLCPSSPSLAVQMNNRFTPCRAADWPWREEASEAVLMFHSKSWEPGRRGIREFKPPNQDCLLFHQVLFSWAASQIFSHAGFPLRVVLLPLWGVFAKGKFSSSLPLAFFPPLSASFPQPCWQYLLWHMLHRRWRDEETVQSLHPLLFSFLKSSLRHQGQWKSLFIFSPSTADQKAEKLVP